MIMMKNYNVLNVVVVVAVVVVAAVVAVAVFLFCLFFFKKKKKVKAKKKKKVKAMFESGFFYAFHSKSLRLSYRVDEPKKSRNYFTFTSISRKKISTRLFTRMQRTKMV